jgi:hypothetical protein
MKTRRTVYRLSVFVLAVLILDMLSSASIAAAQQPVGSGPVPWAAGTRLPRFIGAPAQAHPLPPSRTPQNPSMGPNPFSHDHNDTWMSDTYDIAGPLGREPQVWSSTMTEARRDPNSPNFECPGVTADSQGRLILSCTGYGEWSLVLVDPVTLEVLTYKLLPMPPDLARAVSASYLYLDNHDQAVVPVVDANDGNKVKIQVYHTAGSPGNLGFELAAEYDISAAITEPGDNVNGVLPDWQGRIWFVVRNSATVGVLDPATGSVKWQKLEGSITNSFAMDRDAAYIDTTKYMYRVELGPDGVPQVVWKAGYRNILTKKPGQLSAGSGTTPTILGHGKYVAITDNDNQLHVVVYRTEPQLNPQDQILCEVPVFKEGAGADENSLIGSGLTLIAYNAFGYDLDKVFKDNKSMPTEPGIARVDIDPNGKGCEKVWENDAVELIDTVQKMSTKTGLVYAVTRKWDHQAPGYEADGLDVYYLSAIDVRTGQVVWERLMGTGFGYDAFGDIVIGPNGTVYMPEYGGLIAVRDGS